MFVGYYSVPPVVFLFIQFGTVMVNFTGQLDWATRYSDNWLNVIWMYL